MFVDRVLIIWKLVLVYTELPCLGWQQTNKSGNYCWEMAWSALSVQGSMCLYYHSTNGSEDIGKYCKLGVFRLQ